MAKDQQIKDIIRQELLLEEQIKQLRKKRGLLERKKERLLNTRWELAVRKLVGRNVTLRWPLDEPGMTQLYGRIGTLRKVYRNGTCEVDFSDLGIHKLTARDIRASDENEWHRLFSGE